MSSPARRRRDYRGQALAEFALIIPVFMLVIVAIMEFSFLLTAKIGVTDATQDAAQFAAQLGNTPDADLMILQLVEKDVSPPLSPLKIQSVTIFQTDTYGSASTGSDTYTRGGSLSNGPPPTITVPYTLSGSKGYPEASRCATVNTLICGGVDYIGVTITYQYAWVTPLPGLVALGPAMLFTQTSVCRIEPIQ
jgi:Flp pilus assembly protein TadG